MPLNKNNKERIKLEFYLFRAELLAARVRPEIVEDLKSIRSSAPPDFPWEPRKPYTKRPPLDLSTIKLPKRLEWPSDSYSEAAAK